MQWINLKISHLKNKLIFLKAVLIVVLMVMTHFQTNAQYRIELGGFVGTSYYLGDLNPGNQFREPHLAIGGVARYIFNDRFVVKGTAIFAGLSGHYPQKDVLLNETYDGTYSFNRRVIDVAAMGEYNFMSYDHQFISKTVFTPYITFGLATTLYNRYSNDLNSNDAKPVFVLSLPFGAGVKYKLTDWVRVGAEWTFRKTFVDDLDVISNGGPVNPSDPFGFNQKSSVHNNDWYSFAGVYVTFNLFRRKNTCSSGF
jgi:hypothetical protein